MNILGISSFVHDSACCLLKDGELVAVAEEERFNRIKHSNSFPEQSVKFCLDRGGIGIDDVDYVGFYWQPWEGVLDRVRFMLEGNVRYPGLFMAGPYPGRGGFSTWTDLWRLKKWLLSNYPGSNPKFKVSYMNHHMCHAASTFYTSGFERAAILTLDAGGEKICTMMAEADGSGIRKLHQNDYPHSIGELYLAVSCYLGFDYETGSGKVMGLSSYGQPEYIDFFRRLCTVEGFDVRLDLRYFSFQYNSAKLGFYSDELIRRLGPPRVPGSEITERHQNIAASLQHRVEEVCLELAKRLREKTRMENLCISGGVGLNCVMNGKLKEDSGFKEIHLPPAPNDSGAAVGASLLVHTGVCGLPLNKRINTPYLGPDFSDDECLGAIKEKRLDYEAVADVCARAAGLIAEKKIVGWFQGRMEYGPRALGNRSILADPRDPDMKDILNGKVKFREYFRPFAPVIIREYMKDYFETECDVPYMSMAFSVKDEVRDKIPAVVHVDGTGRVQTVTESQNQLYYGVIESFRKITGIPVLLNTSFNIKGEPIVCRPSEAVRSFLESGMDCLFLGRFLVMKKP